MGAGAFMGGGVSAGPGAFMGEGGFAEAGEELESDVVAPDESVPLFDDESVPVLGPGEIAAADPVDVLAGAAAPWPLQPASSTIKPPATIKPPLWSPMWATTRQRVSRCATVMLLRSAGMSRLATAS